MKFEKVIDETGKSVNWNDQNMQTGFDPAGQTGDYGGDVLPAKKKKKKVTHADDDTMKESKTTTSDVVGLPTNIEAYAASKKDRQKKGGLVRRKVGLVSTKIN